MSVRLSRKTGLFALILDEPRWLDPAEVAQPLSLAVKITRGDAVRACRLQRGILFEGLMREQADAGQRVLKDLGVNATVAPDSEFPALPKAAEVSLAKVTAEAFETPSLMGAGMPRIWPWGDLALVAAGIVLNARGEAERVSGGMEPDLLAEQDVRQAQARRRLEKVKARTFPLAEMIKQSEPEVAAVLASAHRRKVATKKRGLRITTAREKNMLQVEAAPKGEFEGVEILVDLVFTKPFERLRLSTNSRLMGIARSTLPAKNLYAWVRAIAEFANAATLPGATLAVSAGADSGEYLFDDAAQFDDYCRWAYSRRLAVK
ncbi:MAG: hypothetical protein IT462_07805 [Planctomycetes bacterium]|nr:hypothetical protein [Planctomycetota bacterium]